MGTHVVRCFDDIKGISVKLSISTAEPRTTYSSLKLVGATRVDERNGENERNRELENERER